VSKYSCCLFICFFLFILTGCEKAPIPKSNIPFVLVAPAKIDQLPSSIKAVGQVVAIEFVYLVARVEGYLTKRNFNPGDFVKKGQLLYEIQKDQFKAQYNQAKAKMFRAQSVYDNAQIEYNRQAVMLEQNATSKEAVDNAMQVKLDAEAELLSARAEYDLQALNLSYTDIYAPFDGRIGMYTYSVGNVVGAQRNQPQVEPLAEVVQMDPIWVEFPVSETELVTLMEKERGILTSKAQETVSEMQKLFDVRVQLSNNSEYEEAGDINYIDNKINPIAGTIQMRAIFTNPDELLVPGGFVTVFIETKKKFPNLVIMQCAVLDDQIGTYVFVLKEDNTVEKRYVKLGKESSDTRIIVESGLKEGETVVTQGLMRLRPGMKVDYKIQKYNEPTVRESSI